jgi:hypothetical protein
MLRSMVWESIISSVKSLIRIIVISALFLFGCAPKPPKPIVVPEVKELPVPYDLKAESDSHRAILSWSIERSQAPVISGYNIYLGNNSKDSSAWISNPGSPYNQAPYPGDTDGDINHESIPLENLTNGKIYFVIIKTVGPDGAESNPSNMAVFQPLAQGEFILSTNYLVSDGGFNFESGKSVPGRDPRNDLYLYSTANNIGLSSPYRLGAGFRKSKFSALGNGSSSDETIRISRGDKLAIKTRYGQAEITIEDILENQPVVSVKVRYIFYPDNP